MTILAPAAFAQEGGRKVKSKVDPAYPPVAKQMHITGTVKVEVVITAAGAVKSIKVLGGHPLLASAAEEAVKKWKFEPGPAETTEIIPFNFTLNE
ncbi:MAG TPA: energy transducer TonB [Terriglobales bacterium]|jgi:TonB family protein|nr:energy transducer TonB [Terriglobales bacterium]